MSLGIALSGGGIRCVAQLAIIRCLQEHKLFPSVYSGSSAGALVASLLSAGNTPDDIFAAVKELKLFSLVKFSWSKQGLLDIRTALQPITNYLPNTFEDLSTPVVVVATNLETGRYEFFSSGELLPPVLASCCMPVFFSPVHIGAYDYIDAGLTNNFPVDALWGKCRYLIGIHTNPVDRLFKSSSLKSILERTFLLAINGNARPHKSLCHKFLEPEVLLGIKVFDFKRVEEVYDKTIKWMQPQMPMLAEEIHRVMG